ncbi:MAG TPA: neutral/alkaline non-lysosomal ceramidase N-terminal domain-containing protein [Actinomycetota bacterium]|nr:neutral/alkaline non-lysosomal ceramidase N-terminal domain-containing protein [Actinomycetota bacterium]
MTSHRAFRAAVLLLMASFFAMPLKAQADPCAAVLCAGAATADITPPVTTPQWGYTNRQGLLFSASGVQSHITGGNPAGVAQERFVRDKTNGEIELYNKEFVASRGIHLRLQANAFVIQGANGQRVAVVQADLGGIPGELHKAVAKRIAAVTGIAESHLLISATHTHGGPGGFFQYQGYALLGGDEYDPRVFDAVATGLTNAVVTAYNMLAPAKMASTRIAAPGANRNRRVAQWCRNPEALCNGTTPTPASPPAHDDDTTVFRIDTATGLPLGVLTQFPAHGTVGGDGNLLFSGDNQGWATRKVVEGIRAASAPLPDGHVIVNALVNGAQGDVSAVGSGFNQYASMEDAGMRQAAPVLSAWAALKPALRTDVTVDARFEHVCFCGQRIDDEFLYDGPAIDKRDPMWDRVAPYASLGATIVNGPRTTPVPTPAQGNKTPGLVGAGLVPSIVRLQTLRVGDVLFASIPGEANVQVGRRIVNRLMSLPGRPWSTVVIGGLGNDYISYFVTPEEYTAQEYEGGFTLFGPQSSPLMEQELTRLARAMIAGVPVAPCDPSVDAGDCLEHLAHPDTTAAAVTPVAPDLGGSAAVVAAATGTARLSHASMVWHGGGPTAEWRPGADRVAIERLDGSEWVDVAGDAAGGATTIRYEKIDGKHTWMTVWDVPADAAAGRYRFRVEGRTATSPFTFSPYLLTSEFDVLGSNAMAVTVTKGSSWTVRATYPVDPAVSFRIRPLVAGTATLVVVRGGVETTLTAAMSGGVANFALEAGDTLVGASVVDAHGNTGAA